MKYDSETDKMYYDLHEVIFAMVGGLFAGVFFGMLLLSQSEMNNDKTN